MNADTKTLSASLENYLEAIFRIISDKGGVRAKDIARTLGVKAGSVTTALQVLAEGEYINYQPYEVISLTDKGEKEAKEILRKHEVLRDFFTDVLGANNKEAETGACEIEHVISEELLSRLIRFTEFVQACPRCGNGMIERFHQYYKKNEMCDSKECKNCITDGIAGLEQEKQRLGRDGHTLRLVDIEVGSRCVVRGINQKGAARQRLVEMGISRGALIEVERVAPLGDPIEVKVKGYHLSIRKEEAVHVEVEPA